MAVELDKAAGEQGHRIRARKNSRGEHWPIEQEGVRSGMGEFGPSRLETGWKPQEDPVESPAPEIESRSRFWGIAAPISAPLTAPSSPSPNCDGAMRWSV